MTKCHSGFCFVDALNLTYFVIQTKPIYYAIRGNSAENTTR